MSEDKSFEEEKPEFKDFLRGLRVWNSENSDRAIVLVAAAMLDDVLERCVGTFLVESNDLEKLFNGIGAPLGSLSARTLVAYSLGILSKAEYEECNRIRKIRNRFAHEIDASFSDQKVRELCASLNLYVKENDATHKHPRGKFELATIGIIISLTARQPHIAAARLKFSEWPR